MAKTYAQMIADGLITFPSNVDEATKALIYDWFQYREVNDNTLFPNMFKRSLAMSMRKYNQLLRIQPGQPFIVDGEEKEVTYDWLIQSYREALTEEESSGTDGYTLSGTKTGGGTDTRTIRTTGTEVTDRDTTASNTETRDLESNSSSSSSSSDSTTTDEKSLSKANPQSVVYAGGSFPSSLDWTYASGQGENKGSSSSSGTDSSTGQTTDEGTVRNAGSGTEDVTLTHNTTVTDTLQHGLSDANSETKSGSNSGERTVRNIESGRNIDSATLLANAKDFILGSSAWDYLYAQIDKNFQAIILEW